MLKSSGFPIFNNYLEASVVYYEGKLKGNKGLIIQTLRAYSEPMPYSSFSWNLKGET